MSWFDKALTVAREQLGNFFPAVNAVDAAQKFISDAVAQRIRDEACAKGYELLAQTHRSVVTTIVWQNSALLLSLIPVYVLHSAIPFYVAYAGVFGWSMYSVIKAWPLVSSLLVTRSVTQTLSGEVLKAIETELTQRQFFERKAVEWLGPDLKNIANDVAKKLKPDVVASVANMGMTLLMAFVAFRLFAIPLLEHKALLH
jgi:hypothetical protein